MQLWKEWQVFEGRRIIYLSLYQHTGGKLFAEDVKQHLDVLPEVAKSSTEITIDDVYVGDLDVLLTEKSKKLQQL